MSQKKSRQKRKERREQQRKKQKEKPLIAQDGIAIYKDDIPQLERDYQYLISHGYPLGITLQLYERCRQDSPAFTEAA